MQAGRSLNSLLRALERRAPLPDLTAERSMQGSLLCSTSAAGASTAAAAATPAACPPPGAFPTGTAATAQQAAVAEAAAAAYQRDLHKARRLAVPVGAAAGFAGSVAGSGGAAVALPLLSPACPSLPQRLLAGSSLASILSTASVSTAVFALNGCIDLPAAALICAPAMLGAPLGARWTSRLRCDSLRRALAYFLLAAAPLVPLKYYLFNARRAEEEEQVEGRQQLEGQQLEGQQEQSTGLAAAGADASEAARAAPAAADSGGSEQAWWERLRSGMPPPGTAAILVGTGGVAGFAGGLLGIGPATLIIPIVALSTPWQPAAILGTTLAAMVPTATVGLLQHSRLGNVDWRLAAGLAAGSVAGGLAGSQAAVHAPPGALEGAFTVAMLVLARMTLRQLGRR